MREDRVPYHISTQSSSPICACLLLEGETCAPECSHVSDSILFYTFMILGSTNVLLLCIKPNIITFNWVRFYRLLCAEMTCTCWWKETLINTIEHTHTHRSPHVQTAVCTCLKSCRLTAMERKFLMVLERWFTKLSSQKVIGSPWGGGKNENKKNYYQFILAHFSLYQSGFFCFFFLNYVYLVQRWATGTKADAFGAFKDRGSKLNKVVIKLFTALRCSHHVYCHYAL